MKKQHVIEAENLEKSYGMGENLLRVLKGITLIIGRGEIVSIVGPSGAGKSTLLNIIGCLDSFQRGSLRLLDRDISGYSVDNLSQMRNRHIGFIFQLHNLLPEFSALENIMIPLLIRRVNRSDARNAALELLKRFQLAGRKDHKQAELSGGECQRVAVARAIVGKPDIVLADEPTGSLDSANSRLLTQVLFELGKENNSAVVVVTHDMSIAASTERKIELVDGKIVN